MRFSICSTWDKKKTLEEIIDFANILKLDGIEIWDGHIDEYIERNGCSVNDIKEHLAEKGLICSAIAPYFNLLKEDQRESDIERAERCINYANALECKIIRTFIGNKPSSEVTDEEWKRVIEILKIMTGMAENSDIDFALETHYNQPTDTADAVLKIIHNTGSSHLKVLFDGFNYFVDGLDMMEAHGKLRNHIIHYHFKNYIWANRVCKPLSEGDVDFTPLLIEMKKSKYEGFASFEYFCTNPQEIIMESLNWIKSL